MSVRKVKGGYVVISHQTGKRISKVYDSKAEANTRLSEIKHFGKK